MRATIYKGRDQLFQIDLSVGWNRLSRSVLAGIRLFNDGTCLLINCDGTIFFDKIVLQDRLSRWTFNLLGLKQTFGTKDECAPPREVFVMRTKRPSLQAPSNFRYGDVFVPFASSFAHASPQAFVPQRLGMYAVTGTKQADTPGGDGIAPIQGGEQDVAWLIARSDATINRTALAWLDMATGEPLPKLTQARYGGSRGWHKDTQIAEVCDKYNPNDQYDDRRKPKSWNSGNCAYFADISGIDRYNSYVPPDWQHGIRSLGPIMAAAACGDEAAQFMLRILAADARYCHPSVVTGQKGMGSGYYGSRECAWVTTALLQARETYALGIAALDGMELVQTANGCMMTAPNDYPFSPPPNGDADDFWQQSMELWLCCHPLALDGRHAPIRKALVNIFEAPWMASMGYVPKHLRVKKGNAYDTSIVKFSGGADYFPWVALGAYACLQPRDPAWKQWMLKIATPTQGKATNIQDLKTKLRKEAHAAGAGQIVAALSILELTTA